MTFAPGLRYLTSKYFGGKIGLLNTCLFVLQCPEMLGVYQAINLIISNSGLDSSYYLDSSEPVQATVFLVETTMLVP